MEYEQLTPEAEATAAAPQRKYRSAALAVASLLLVAAGCAVAAATLSSSEQSDRSLDGFRSSTLQSADEGTEGYRLTIFHTGDVHGYINGNRHRQGAADFGDFVSLIEYKKESYAKDGKDLLVLDSGDFVDGSGLSDAPEIHGEEIYKAVSKVPYDILSVGNHDIGHEETVQWMKKNFIPQHQGKWLAANVFWTNEDGARERMGDYYRTIKTQQGKTVTVLGWLYNFNQASASLEVDTVSQSLKDPEFKAAMDVDSDVIIVCAHIAPQDKEIKQIYDAIRKHHETKPLILLTGHRHQPFNATWDDDNFLIEAIYQFRQLSHIEFGLGADGQMTDFSWEYLDSTVENFAELAGVSPKDFGTENGKKLKKQMADAASKYKLDEVLGCADQSYWKYGDLKDENNLYHVYLHDVVPKYLFQKSENRQIFVSNPFSLRSNIYKGKIFRDDLYSLCPFADHYYTFPPMKGDLLKKLVGDVKTLYEHANWRLAEMVLKDEKIDMLKSATDWLATEAIDDDTVYEVIAQEYDSVGMEMKLEKLKVKGYPRSIYRKELTNTNIFEIFFQNEWKCDA